jgi:hypothetical protein
MAVQLIYQYGKWRAGVEDLLDTGSSKFKITIEDTGSAATARLELSLGVDALQVSIDTQYSRTERAYLKVIGGKLALVDSTSRETSGAHADLERPLLLFSQVSPGYTGRNNRLVDVDVASAKTTDTGRDDGDRVGALTSVAEEEVRDVGESETVVFTGLETRRNSERVGKSTNGVDSLQVVGQSTSEVGVRGVHVETLSQSVRFVMRNA